MKPYQNFSNEHLKYLKKEKNRQIQIWIFRFAILAFILLSWELLALFGLIDTFILSSPSKIFKTLANLFVNDNMLFHIGITLYETIVGFIVAVLLGTVIALLLWLSEFAQKVIEPYLVVLNSLPKIALGPIIIVAFGSGSKSIIFMAVLIGIIVTIINMLSGFLSTDKGKIQLLKTMGANKFQLLTKLVLPSSLKTFISTLKVDVGMAWIGSIMGEYIASKAGLGYLLVYGAQVFKLDLVMATIVVLCVLASLMYLSILILEKVLIKNY